MPNPSRSFRTRLLVSLLAFGVVLAAAFAVGAGHASAAQSGGHSHWSADTGISSGHTATPMEECDPSGRRSDGHCCTGARCSSASGALLPGDALPHISAPAALVRSLASRRLDGVEPDPAKRPPIVRS